MMDTINNKAQLTGHLRQISEIKDVGEKEMPALNESAFKSLPRGLFIFKTFQIS